VVCVRPLMDFHSEGLINVTMHGFHNQGNIKQETVTSLHFFKERKRNRQNYFLTLLPVIKEHCQWIKRTANNEILSARHFEAPTRMGLRCDTLKLVNQYFQKISCIISPKCPISNQLTQGRPRRYGNLQTLCADTLV